ncbi:uncharacterized protein ASCRUDRAFT_76577 [Ascoidea rubescens DSM 1968]|uniref:Uncharacterized protein n=1 Tax=Ascoidea rubescens DSM 1968 TaxID=1344418 RepID=A0A1D2VEW7_9ASCO|nr:hypothetical protein ASCRUDRAFT_76577 [Ascoidea rubescens DSM 1968]ODV60053.1 hypothetical protein ASCRUDRAFT_76577 [Ascoidea rubescens DSM 1968]
MNKEQIFFDDNGNLISVFDLDPSVLTRFYRQQLYEQAKYGKVITKTPNDLP